MNLKGRSILALKDLTLDEIECILDKAKEMKEILKKDDKKHPILKGKSIITLFFEASTRTRSSFELAGKYLGADVVNISQSSSSMTKGESLRDTIHTLEEMMVSAFIIRSPYSGACEYAHSVTDKVIINAGDGTHAHPTQGLLDLLTLQEHFGKNLQGLKVAIIGDILHSRVARSNIAGLSKYGVEVHLAGPQTLIPPGLPNAIVHDNVDAAISNADAINILRIQTERQKAGYFPSMREYSRVYGITTDKIKLAKPNVLILHPGPQNRGLEIATDLMYSDRSQIAKQVHNGIAVRMAILALTI